TVALADLRSDDHDSLLHRLDLLEHSSAILSIAAYRASLVSGFPERLSDVFNLGGIGSEDKELRELFRSLEDVIDLPVLEVARVLHHHVFLLGHALDLLAV